MNFLDNLLETHHEKIYALMRIVTGFLFIWHGAQKLFNFPKEFPYPLNPLMYTAGTIEIIGGGLVMIGLLTRPAAFICSGMMAVAYWMYYGSKAFNPPADTTNSFLELTLPIVNNGELAVMFCFSMLYIAARGSGIWSIDSARK